MSRLDTDTATIGDLYRALDWAAVEALETQGDAQFEVDADFKRRYRLVLLDEALYGSGARRDAARTLLSSAGVWDQVVALLRSSG